MAIPLPASPGVIVVSGLPRSGTSMMMKMLMAGGIPPLTDAIRQADSDNPEGYFEFQRAKRLDKGDVDWLDDAEGKAVKVISALLPHLPNTHKYRVIFMERAIQEVLASQRKMLVNRGSEAAAAEDERLVAIFEKHLGQTKAMLASRPNVSVLYVHYRAVLDHPRLQVDRVVNFLERPLKSDLMIEAVNAQLYRNRQG